jgi:hypothetical protein
MPENWDRAVKVNDATHAAWNAHDSDAVGPAREVDEKFGLSDALDSGAAAIFSDNPLVVASEVAAKKRLGAVQATRWLRAALGGLYLLSRHAGHRASLGAVPADAPATSVFVGPAGGGRFERITHQFRISRAHDLDVDTLLAGQPAREFLEDCLSEEPPDLVAERLTQCAPWFQIGVDALAYPDAVLALGIALEALVGSEGQGNVVEMVSRRSGYLLREGSNNDEKALNGLDWAKKAAKYYGERSAVAHARYVEESGALPAQLDHRSGFEELVFRAAWRFRDFGRAEGWKAYKDMKAWWELSQMA